MLSLSCSSNWEYQSLPWVVIKVVKVVFYWNLLRSHPHSTTPGIWIASLHSPFVQIWCLCPEQLLVDFQGVGPHCLFIIGKSPVISQLHLLFESDQNKLSTFADRLDHRCPALHSQNRLLGCCCCTHQCTLHLTLPCLHLTCTYTAPYLHSHQCTLHCRDGFCTLTILQVPLHYRDAFETAAASWHQDKWGL